VLSYFKTEEDLPPKFESIAVSTQKIGGREMRAGEREEGNVWSLRCAVILLFFVSSSRRGTSGSWLVSRSVARVSQGINSARLQKLVPSSSW